MPCGTGKEQTTIRSLVATGDPRTATSIQGGDSLHILVVEDNPTIATNLYGYLEACGHCVETAPDGIQGFRLAWQDSIDVVLLDLAIRHTDGMQLYCRLRKEKHVKPPILMLTPRDMLRDMLTGLELFEDDYVVKPFALEEVDARVRALHRRRIGRGTTQAVKVGDLTYDPAALVVTLAGTRVKLPPKCLRLLDLLISNPGRVFSRKEIEFDLWGERQETSDRMRYHMHLLRRSLLDAGGRDPIETVHGKGFRLPPEA